MEKKKDPGEEQKEKLITEIILIKYPSIGINPPTRKETTLERENRERLEEAVDPSHTKNSPFTIHIESHIARLKKKSLEELAIILEEERNKKARDKAERLKTELDSEKRSFDMPKDQADFQSDIKAEKDCQAWLEGLMSYNSTQTKTKIEYQNDARGKFKVGTNAFNRAWANAKASSDNLNWGKAGRRKGKP